MTMRSGGADVPTTHVAAEAACTRDTSESAVWSAADLAKLSAILGRKWTASIVVTLRSAPIRHGDLCRRLSGISRKVLHESLDALIHDGLVEKIIGVDDVGGPSVTYGLTPLGSSLSPVFDAMQLWCDSHLRDVVTTRSDGGAAIRVSSGLTNPAVT
jgi:DNA-binding HxlR family transcriptional regulator